MERWECSGGVVWVWLCGEGGLGDESVVVVWLGQRQRAQVGEIYSRHTNGPWYTIRPYIYMATRQGCGSVWCKA